MTRYGIAAYLIIVVGLITEIFFIMGHYIKAAYAYQTANHITSGVQEGSYWLTTNTEPFLIPGVTLVIIGMAMAFYDANKRMATTTSGSGEVAKP